MIELETYTGGALFFEIDLGIEEPEFSEQMAECKDFLSNLARETGKSLKRHSLEAEQTVSSISPLLLGENPYHDSDPWIVKCLKSVYHSTRILFLMTDKIHKALETYQGSQEVMYHIESRTYAIEKEANENYQNTLRVHFTLEALKALQEETLDDGNALIEGFVSSFGALLHARTFFFEEGKKVELTPEKRDTLLVSFREELTERLQTLDPSHNTDENRQALQSQVEALIRQRTALTEKLHALDEFIQGPLDRQLPL